MDTFDDPPVGYCYHVTPRSDELGGGWKIQLLEGEREVGGGHFPKRCDDPDGISAWWDGLGAEGRLHWLGIARSDDPAQAWHAFSDDQAWQEACDFGEEWLATRPSESDH